VRRLQPAIVSKIAAECAALYEEVAVKLAQPHLREALAKEWSQVVDWNRVQFDGMQNFWFATTHLEKMEYGMQVSRLTYATNKTSEAVQMCAKADKTLQDQFKRANAMCLEAYVAAKKDNDLVYNEKVPPTLSLPKPDRRAMVKAIRLAELDVAEPVVEPRIEKQGSSATQTGTQYMCSSPGTSRPPAGASAPLPPIENLAVAPAPAADPPPPSFAAAEAAGLAELVAMGFAEDKARQALIKASGSVEGATDLLLVTDAD